MKIRTFRTVESEKYADLIDWRSVPLPEKDQKKSFPKVNQAENLKRPKRGVISYNEEESE
jgi:hypothetical protein